MSAPKKVDLAALSAGRRKRGRVANHDPKLLAEITSLGHGEGLPYTEASMTTDAFQRELAQELPKITKVTGDESESVAVFANRWLSRYRQRARAMWDAVGLPSDEFDFVVLNTGEVYIGRK
jgi:hypothetical protein